MSDETTPQDDAAMSPASAGSVGEPAAWGVLRVGGGWVSILANEVQAETSRKYFGKMEIWVHEIVPLYHHPRVAENATTGLTDAEREAVERGYCSLMGVEDMSAECSRWDAEAAAALRGLLDRTK